MRIAAVCPTYKRPKLLGRAIHCFLQQTYDDCELIILDDANQYKTQDCIDLSGKSWRIYTTDQRYEDLAAKRQALAEIAATTADAFLCWDDDDVFFPEAIARVARALEEKPWAQCRTILESAGKRKLAPTVAFGRKILNVGDEKVDSWGYGGCWAYRLKEFHDVGGYQDLPFNSACEDIDLAKRFYLAYGESADSSAKGSFYWYNRDPGVSKVSTQGLNFWAEREKWECEKVDEIPIGWNGPDMYKYSISNVTQPRPF